MELVYRFLHNLILAILILSFYQKIIKNNTPNAKQIGCFLSASFVFSIYMYFTYPYIIEPFRSIVGILILGLFYWIWKRFVNWAALVLAFLSGYLILIISAFIVSIASVLLSIDQSETHWYLALFIEMSIFFASYKLIKLKNGISSIEDNEVKGIILAITGIILAFFGVYHISVSRLSDVNPLLFSASFVALVFVIVALIALIIFLAKKHKQLKDLTSEIKKLETDRKELLFENNELDIEFRRLSIECRELISKNHKYKDVIPAYADLIKLLQNTDIDNAHKQLNTLMEMAEEISGEFEDEHIAGSLKGLRIPETWKPLELYISRFAKECKNENIQISLQNNVKKETWESLAASKVELIRLVGNLLGNAKKELHKTETDLKHITLIFRDKNNVFEFEVADTAHKFSAEVLSKLGQRGNSTNGTGDGYVEIFEFLKKYNASLDIIEVAENDSCNKRVKITFDGRLQVNFYTNSRYEELKEMLQNTDTEVLQL